MDCNEINDPNNLVSRFRENDELTLNLLFKCFFTLYYSDYRKFVFKFCAGRSYSKYKEEELTTDSFEDGLLAFYDKLKIDGFEEKGARLKTVFFAFCKYKLMGALTNLKRLSKKEISKEIELDNDETQLKMFDVEELNYFSEALSLQDEEEIFLEALYELGERGTNLLIWKKVLKLSNEEISKRMNIKPGTVPNEVYKAFNKIKFLAAKIKEERN